MKLSHLVEHHRKWSEHGLVNGFGDGYLVANNRIYRRIRSMVLQSGFKFSSDRNIAFETFPLLQLEDILQTRVLPYSPNSTAFESLGQPQLVLLDWSDVEGNLKKNFTLHEGCHGLVRDWSNTIFGQPMAINTSTFKPDIKLQRSFALRVLLEESCANTSELLATVDVHDQLHRVFFEMNSYMGNFENRTHLAKAFVDLGEPVVTLFITLSYLHANLLRSSIDDRDFTTMWQFASGGSALTPQQLKMLRPLGKIAFQLSERFRLQTTGFHLRLAGISTPMRELFDFDYLSELKSENYRRFLSQWSTFTQ